MEKVRVYWQLTKPGVLLGNVLTAVAGYFLAAAGKVDMLTFLAMLSGMTLVIASACVINNFLDRDIDAKMERTKSRPSVVGAVKGRHIAIYGAVLGLIGTAILVVGTNPLVVGIGLAGWITYVWLYGAWTKRTSIHGTAVGAVSGAFPIAGGYAAAQPTIDAGLIIVFLILFFWQFPEFYSIAIYRRKEYAAAKIPVMPVVKGVRSTIIQIFIYTILYVGSTLALFVYGYVYYTYLIVIGLTGAYWLWVAYRGLRTKKPETWAREMFKFSMTTILVLCLMLSIGPLLP